METSFENEENHRNESKTAGPSILMWRDFVGNTTLHGLRYVFVRRPRWIRALWLLLLLTAGGYYISIVCGAVTKFTNRPMSTVISTNHAKVLDFPAVTICPLNSLSRRKITIRDQDPEFVKEGLNMTECATTADVRAGRSCGVALLCCCTTYNLIPMEYSFPECTKDYKDELIASLKKRNVSPDISQFVRLYGIGHREFLTPQPICSFGLNKRPCSFADFEPVVNSLGICFTFNSGKTTPLKKAYYQGTAFGLNVLLDAQTRDYSTSQLSQGFRITVHHPGEYVAPWDGINVGPGTHVALVTSREEVANLQAPYSTNCKEKKLKQFSRYSRQGCIYECEAENILAKCKCRLSGHHADAPFCGSNDDNCTRNADFELDHKKCDCQVPCSHVKYKTTASYSKFPDALASTYFDTVYNWTDKYKRENLVFLQVGYTSLSYEIRAQRAAYDSGALFGEIGGNMGLFLGCSLLTLCEFVDFIMSVLIARRRRRVLAV